MFLFSSLWQKLQDWIILALLVITAVAAVYGYYEHTQAKETKLAYHAQVQKDNTAALTLQNQALTKALAAATHRAAENAAITVETTARNQKLQQAAHTLTQQLTELEQNDKTYAAWRALCLPAQLIRLYHEPYNKICFGGIPTGAGAPQHSGH